MSAPRTRFGMKTAFAAALLGAVGFSAFATGAAQADPPPGRRRMAGAHNRRSAGPFVEKHDPAPSGKDEQQARQRRPQLEGTEFGCNSDVIGAVTGGVIGAAIGSQIGDGDGQTAAIIGGAILGLFAGNAIGQSVDQANANCINQTMETVPDWQPVVWHDPVVHQTGRADSTEPKRYALTPTRTYTSPAGFICRDYVTTVTINGQLSQSTGTACREPDGRWRIVA